MGTEIFAWQNGDYWRNVIIKHTQFSRETRKLSVVMNSNNKSDITVIVLTFRTPESLKTVLKYESQYHTSLPLCPCKLVKCNQRTQEHVSGDRLLVFDLKTGAGAAIFIHFGVFLINVCVLGCSVVLWWDLGVLNIYRKYHTPASE